MLNVLLKYFLTISHETIGSIQKSALKGLNGAYMDSVISFKVI